jgi:hypothetical protein
MMIFFFLFSNLNFWQVPAGLVCRLNSLLYQTQPSLTFVITSLRSRDRTILFPVQQLPSRRQGFSFRFSFTFLTPIHLAFFTSPHHPIHTLPFFHYIPSCDLPCYLPHFIASPLHPSLALSLSFIFPAYTILLSALPPLPLPCILPTFCYEALPSPFCLSYSPFIYL